MSGKVVLGFMLTVLLLFGSCATGERARQTEIARQQALQEAWEQANPQYDRAADFSVEVSGNSVTITGYLGENTAVRIPPQIHGMPVTIIGDAAFQSKGIASVNIPDSVTSIGSFAFADNELTHVTIPARVAAIGAFAFANNKLTDVTIHHTIASIGANAFSGNRLDSIPMTAQQRQQAEAAEARRMEQERAQAEQNRLAALFRQGSVGNMGNTSWRFTGTAPLIPDLILEERFDFGDGTFLHQINNRTRQGDVFADAILGRRETITGTFRVNGDTVIFRSSAGTYSAGTVIGNALTLGSSSSNNLGGLAGTVIGNALTLGSTVFNRIQ